MLEAAGPLRIPPTVYNDDQNQDQDSRKACEWISNRNEYSGWLNCTHSQLLRLICPPSCGKATVLSFLVEKLRQKTRESREASLAAFSCDSQEGGGDTPTAILRSLVFQLLLQRNELYHYIRADFERGAEGSYFDDHLNDFPGLWRNLRNMLQDEQAGPVFIVVNALDTCSAPTRQNFLHSIKHLFDGFSPRSRDKLKLLVIYGPNSVEIGDELGNVGVVLDVSEANLSVSVTESTETGCERSITSIDHQSYCDTFDNTNHAKYISTVELLLSRGANMVSKDNRSGRSPLSWAARSGQEAMVKLLLNRGVDIECTDNLGQTPIFFAAEKGHDAVIRLLVDSGAHVNAKDGNGCTPLLRAAKVGYLPVVKLLLRNGARVDYDSNKGHTPVSVAAENGHSGIVQVLLANGAAADSGDLAYGRTPLSRAAENGHDSICQTLCESGAEVDSKDIHQQTPLLWATRNGHERCVELLLRHGATTNVRDSIYSQTPMIWACRYGHESIVKLLVDSGARIDASDNSGRTPLSWAAGNGNPDIVNLLLSRGAKVNSSDQNRRTSLSWAAGNGQTGCVRQLLNRSREFGLRDRYGRTPLSWALENAYGSIVTMLREGTL